MGQAQMVSYKFVDEGCKVGVWNIYILNKKKAAYTTVARDSLWSRDLGPWLSRSFNRLPRLNTQQ